MKFKILSALLLLSAIQLVLSPVFSQNKFIKIGDTVPDFKLGEFLFRSKPYMQLSELKGKLVILDFWIIGCIPCVKAMPKYDELQKLFGDKLAIIPIVTKKANRPVTTSEFEQAKKDYASFWKKSLYTKQTSFTTIIDTTGLRWNFTSTSGVPYEVWINGDGVLIGLTNGDAVNEREINSVLSGNFVSATTVGEEIEYKKDEPLLISNNSHPKSSLLSYTAITPYLPVNSGGRMSENYSYDSVSNISRLSIINTNFDALISSLNYKLSNGKPLNSVKNRIIWEVNDPSKYIYNKDEYIASWVKRNSYCFETILSGLVKEDSLQKRIRDEALSFFGLSTGFERRYMDCWTLIRTSKNDSLLVSKDRDIKIKGNTTGSVYANNWRFNNDVKYVTRTYSSIEDLLESIDHVNALKEQGADGIPVVDETGIVSEIRVVLNFNIDKKTRDPQDTDFKSPLQISNVRKQLLKYGLDLVRAKRELEVFVIRENDYKPNES